MKYEEILLIGGPCDGQRMSVMAGIPTVQVCVPVEPAAFLGDISAPNVARTASHPVYHRHPMHSSSGFVGSVYVAEGVDPLPALIAGYRQPK
ncbi:hypothetical protein H8F21_22160 [Pseudomonas sp. P66]|uniref:Uncharacterized protein n=1 Tax=Pseudomonas arcuscaelestis TaxID=2710591 RepID=A0ABS2C331_9PSED|nr:hypothetical protein [Pseudomonas arcuscaelestis]MBM5460272.1 hypothetical protein [Pseudomonas arcuscaelestis]